MLNFIWTCERYTVLFFFLLGSKMLYIVGLGLADERDISVKGLEIVRKADRVYLEAYTAILLVDKEQLVCMARRQSHNKVADF